MQASAHGVVDVEGIRLSNPNKVLYPEAGVTKLALAQYYVAVADHILPHIVRRPITLLRCPTGRHRNCFYQRHPGSGLPPQWREIAVPGFKDPYLYLQDRAGLIALVQLGVLEIHPWGARIDRTDRSDRMIFDLDPGEGLGFADVVAAALDLRRVLQGLGLVSFVKTTGGKGLHLVLPIERRHDWTSVKAFAKAIAQGMAAHEPARFLTRISKAERSGRVFIDYLRNDPTSTAIAPFSTRARAGVPVATPLAWEELDAKLDPAAFDIAMVPQRLAHLRTNPWQEIGRVRQRLPALAAELTRGA